MECLETAQKHCVTLAPLPRIYRIGTVGGALSVFLDITTVKTNVTNGKLIHLSLRELIGTGVFERNCQENVPNGNVSTRF